MNIIEQYIEMNNEVLSKLTRENPELGTGIIDTLAVLSNYIKDNDVQFTAEQTSKILQKVEEVQSEEEEKKEQQLKVAEDKSKEIQQAVEKIDNLDNQNCTYIWVRDWLGDKRNSYFVLGLTADDKANSMLVSTYLKDDVFTDNPTPANKLVREVFMSTGKLMDLKLGVFLWTFSKATTNLPKVTNLSSYTNKVIDISKSARQSLVPNLLLKEGDGNATQLLVQGAKNVVLNKKDYEFDDLLAQDLNKIRQALNTLQMVAWAEGIDLAMNTTTDFFDLADFYNDAINKSKYYNSRVYLMLTRDTLTTERELGIVIGSTSAEQIVNSKGENNAFVVGILVHGAFQNDINPYMFSQAVAQPTIQQANVSTIVLSSNDLEEIKQNAKIASEASTEKMYVVELNNGFYSYEAGADNLFILQSTNELKDVVVVFENGVEIPYNYGYEQPKESVSDVFVETTDELTDEDLEGLDNMDDLGEIELEDLEDLPDLDFEQE